MKTTTIILTAVSAIAAAAALAAVILKPRRMVEINCNLTPEEHDKICGEFGLKPDKVMMQYIYRRGGQKRFGVRLAHEKLRSDDIVRMFTIPIIKEKLPAIMRKKGSYPASDNTLVKAHSFTPQAKRGKDYKVHIFEEDGCGYMEIEKPRTENIGIFLHS